MEDLFPEVEDDLRAVEGTLAHEVAAAVLAGLPVPSGATDEMLDGADLWEEVVGKFKGVEVEQEVDCSAIHPDCFGTPDAWQFDSTDDVLRVFDYKFGHRHVEVFENWQLLSYASGVIDSFALSPRIVELTIVQPRSYHPDGPVRTWALPIQKLDHYAGLLMVNCLDAMNPDAGTTTGPECRDCSARRACPTLQASTYSVIEFSGKSIPFDLKANEIGRELTMVREAIALLGARESCLADEILGRIKQGTVIPGWMTKQGSGREKWAKPIDEVLALGDMMGVDLSKPSAITPKQAIKAGIPAELVRQYSETPVGSVSLVPFKQTKEFE